MKKQNKLEKITFFLSNLVIGDFRSQFLRVSPFHLGRSVHKRFVFPGSYLYFSSCVPACTTSIFVFPKPHPVSFWLVYSPAISLCSACISTNWRKNEGSVDRILGSGFLNSLEELDKSFSVAAVLNNVGATATNILSRPAKICTFFPSENSRHLTEEISNCLI